MSPTFKESLRTFPMAFWVLIGATFVNKFGVFVVPFLTIFMTRSGFSPAQAGWTVAAYAAGGFLAAGLGGWLADRIGRNVTMAAASLLGAASLMLLSQAHTFPLLVALSFLTGVLSEAGIPATNALVQDIIPPEHRLAAYATMRFSINLGWALGPMAAGFLAEHSFFWLFAGDAATAAFFGLVALFLLPRGKRGERKTSGWSHALVSIRHNRPFLALAAACITVSIVFRQLTTTFALHFENHVPALAWHGFYFKPLELYGFVMAVNGMMICLMEMPLTAVTRGWPVRNCIALGYIGMSGSFLVLAWGSGLTAFLLAMIVFTFGEMMAFSRQQAYAASLAPDDMRGRYSGFLSWAWSAGNISASVLSMGLYQYSPNLVWISSALLGAVGAMLIAGHVSRPVEVAAPLKSADAA
ncbi:MAG: MFS transporter [Verrucomicrobium sp.]